MAEVPFSSAGTMRSAGVQSQICRSVYANASHTALCTGRPQILVHVHDWSVTRECEQHRWSSLGLREMQVCTQTSPENLE